MVSSDETGKKERSDWKEAEGRKGKEEEEQKRQKEKKLGKENAEMGKGKKRMGHRAKNIQFRSPTCTGATTTESNGTKRKRTRKEERNRSR